MGDVHVSVEDPTIPDPNQPGVGGWEPGPTELRITALDRAINYHQNREADPNKVIDTAETFLSFIKGA